MAAHSSRSQHSASSDAELSAIADYVLDTSVSSDEAFEPHTLLPDGQHGVRHARLAISSVRAHPARSCRGPSSPKGSACRGRLSTRSVKAAFDIGCMIRWLDFTTPACGGVGPSFGQPRPILPSRTTFRSVASESPCVTSLPR